jgi:hypothetical protein
VRCCVLALRQHAIPAELARMVLSRLVPAPEEYEDGIDVPVRPTLALHSLAPVRFKLTGHCTTCSCFGPLAGYYASRWEQISH